jgi:hypothetical protein
MQCDALDFPGRRAFGLIPLDPSSWLPDSNGAVGAMPYGLHGFADEAERIQV